MASHGAGSVGFHEVDCIMDLASTEAMLGEGLGGWGGGANAILVQINLGGFAFLWSSICLILYLSTLYISTYTQIYMQTNIEIDERKNR